MVERKRKRNADLKHFKDPYAGPTLEQFIASVRRRAAHNRAMKQSKKEDLDIEIPIPAAVEREIEEELG